MMHLPMQDWVTALPHDVVGNLDANVSFIQQGLHGVPSWKVRSVPELGVAGTRCIDGDFHSYMDSYVNGGHVNGQIRLYLRVCFGAIGGYVPDQGRRRRPGGRDERTDEGLGDRLGRSAPASGPHVVLDYTVRHEQRAISPELMVFHRGDRLQRLKRLAPNRLAMERA